MKFLEKEWKGQLYRLYALRDKQSLWIHHKGRTWLWKNIKEEQPRSTEKKKIPSGLILSPLPCRIQKVFVKPGERIKQGQSLLILSAMKMEYHFKAEGAGLVKELFCQQGQTVDSGKELIKIAYTDPA